MRCSPWRWWPRWRSERDFWRFADQHLRTAFPALFSQSQFNRRVRAAEPLLRRLQQELAAHLTTPAAVYHVVDTTLIPAIERVRACRHGLFAGEASFGRYVSMTEWVYCFKLELTVDPQGIVTTFGLAAANGDERAIGDVLISREHCPAYLADKGFASVEWERACWAQYASLVATTPTTTAKRAWDQEACRWAAGKRQVSEQVIYHLKDFFAMERHRSKTLGGLLARVAAKVTAYAAGQVLNQRHERSLRQLANLLV